MFGNTNEKFVNSKMPYIINPDTGKYITEKGSAYYRMAEKIGFRKIREMPRYMTKPGRNGKPRRMTARQIDQLRHVNHTSEHPQAYKPTKRIAKPRKPRKPMKPRKRTNTGQFVAGKRTHVRGRGRGRAQQEQDQDRESVRDRDRDQDRYEKPEHVYDNEPVIHERIIERRPVRYQSREFDQATSEDFSRSLPSYDDVWDNI